MKKQNRALHISIISVLIVAALVLIYIVSSGIFFRKSAGISLAGGQGEAVNSDFDAQANAKLLHQVMVTKENIKDVVMMLGRPAAYSYKLENTLYYKGGTAVTSYEYFRRASLERFDAFDAQGATQQVEIVKNGTSYVWIPGQANYYKGKSGMFQADGGAALPHYLDITKDDTNILSVSQRSESEPLVLVAFMKNGYRCVYTLSVINGLLMQADFYSGETMVRRVTMQDVSTEVPNATLFALPNGTSLLGD